MCHCSAMNIVYCEIYDKFLTAIQSELIHSVANYNGAVCYCVSRLSCGRYL